MRRIMIAGTGSGCGKTTVTCGILSALRQRSIRVSAFKCGPDYIDPMFYREILHAEAHNLDSFFCDENMLRYQLAEGSQGTEIAVLEGAMGFYDGGDGSAYRVSEITSVPVILVVNCRGMKESIGAIIKGFLHYQHPNQIAGFIFNQLPESLIPFVRQLCAECGTAYFGCLPKHPYTLESRHLGLVTANEISDICEKMDALGTLAEQHIEIDRILHHPCNFLPEIQMPCIPKLSSKPVIAVARDKAFCFQYAENIALLEKLGCVIRYFSPLEDSHLPQADGLILCGGYPELYAEKLSQNRTMRRDIQKAIQDKMPTIAECGGFMYLHDTLRSKENEVFEMAGVIRGEVFYTKKLQRFGYISMTSQADNLICRAGETLKAHEFHYWDSTDSGNGFAAEKPDGRSWRCCHISDSMYAGFPHLYFPSDIQTALRFARACAGYGEKDETYTTD
ncbi:MAG: cobyrinate a,c-diamide synthase [Oscillospiraceae bacterium]|nr:cobyrinate a,c-diamide synthase [Oscillospiraceae bacterium]